MKTFIVVLFIFIFFNMSIGAQTYKGKAWHDSTQTIPGKIQCELYDEGGQEIAYKDSDTGNNGSGKLNPNDGTFLISM